MTPQEIRKAVDMIKVSAGCQICGYNKHPAALSFDHVNPSNKYRTKSGKKVHIADMVKGGRYGWDTIITEIRKCRVLCSNCHMEFTHTRLDLDELHLNVARSLVRRIPTYLRTLRQRWPLLRRTRREQL